jgi:hypothetical protein
MHPIRQTTMQEALDGLVGRTFQCMRINSLKTMTIVASIAIATLATGGGASADESPQVTQEIGNRTYYSDGSVEVEFPAGTMSLGECGSGQFCVWSQANYLGSFRYRTGTGSKTLGGTVGSFWNNRSTVARLYNNNSSASICYENGVKKSSVATSYSSAEKVYLYSSANC